MGQPLSVQLLMLACGGEKGYGDGSPPTHDSAVSPCFHGCLAFSTGISNHSLLPHIPSVCLSTVNSSPHPGIAPQSLNSNSQLLRLPGDLCPYPGYVWLQQGLSVLIPSRLPQISCFTLSLKCFSSNPDICPNVGIRPLLQFPHCRGQVQSCFPPLVPSSYRVLHGSIYSFPLVRYSCLLSAGVMHALLCLKVCSSCIHGERGTPCPPTLLPSCSPLLSFLIQRYFGGESIYENTFLQNGSLVHMFCILNFSF